MLKRISSIVGIVLVAMFALAECLHTDTVVWDEETSTTKTGWEHVVGVVSAKVRGMLQTQPTQSEEATATPTQNDETWRLIESENGKFDFLVPESVQEVEHDSTRYDFADETLFIHVECLNGTLNVPDSELGRWASWTADSFNPDANVSVLTTSRETIDGKHVVSMWFSGKDNGDLYFGYMVLGTYPEVRDSCAVMLFSKDPNSLDRFVPVAATIFGSISWNTGLDGQESVTYESRRRFKRWIQDYQAGDDSNWLQAALPTSRMSLTYPPDWEIVSDRTEFVDLATGARTLFIMIVEQDATVESFLGREVSHPEFFQSTVQKGNDIIEGVLAVEELNTSKIQLIDECGVGNYRALCRKVDSHRYNGSVAPFTSLVFEFDCGLGLVCEAFYSRPGEHNFTASEWEMLGRIANSIEVEPQ